jgi:hypothetical protein
MIVKYPVHKQIPWVSSEEGLKLTGTQKPEFSRLNLKETLIKESKQHHSPISPSI